MTSFKRKALTFALASSMVIGQAAFVQAADQPSRYDTIKDLGIIEGEGNGTDSAQNLSRYRAFGLQLKMTGKWDEMMGYDASGKPNYLDTADKSGFMLQLMSYLKNVSKLTGFPDGQLKPLEGVTGVQFTKLMLDALGYVQGVDYEYATVADFAVEIGLIASKSQAGSNTITEEAAANLMYDTLCTNPKGSNHSLGEELEDLGYAIVDTIAPVGEIDEIDAETMESTVTVTGSFSEAVSLKINSKSYDVKEDNSFSAEVDLVLGENTITIVAEDASGNKYSEEFSIVRNVKELSVDKVYADSLMTVKVEMNTEVDPASVVVENFSIKDKADGIQKVELAEDNKTVIVYVKTPFEQTSDQEFVYIKNLKSTNGLVMKDVEDKEFTVRDVSSPYIEKVSFLKNNEIQVVFSEPVVESDAVNTANYKLNGDNLVGSVTKYDYNTVTIYSTRFLDENVITVSGIKDFANLKMDKQDVEFAYQADDSAPTITRVVDATIESVKVEFSEPIDENSVNHNNVKWGYSTAQLGKQATDFVMISNRIVEFLFEGSNAIAPNSNDTILIINGIKDLSGNEIAKDSTIGVVAMVDNTRPEVKEVKVVQESDAMDSTTKNGQSLFTVSFTKKVVDSDDEKNLVNNFEIRDKDDKVVDATIALANADDNTNATDKIEFSIDNLQPGKYTLTIKNLKDSTVLGNSMLTYTTNVTIANKMTPDFKEAYFATGNKLYVEFTEAMNNTITNPSNYVLTLIDGKRVNLSDQLVGSISTMKNNSIAVMTLKGSTDYDSTPAYAEIEINGVQNDAGNTIKNLRATIELNGDNVNYNNINSVAPAVEKIEVTSHKEMKIYLDREVLSPYYRDFTIMANQVKLIDKVQNFTTATEKLEGIGNVTVFTLVYPDNTFNYAGDYIVNADATEEVIVSVANAKYTKDIFGNNLQDDAGSAVVDKVSPTIVLAKDKIVSSEKDMDAKTLSFVLDFDEDLAAAEGLEAFGASDLVINKKGSTTPLLFGRDYTVELDEANNLVVIVKLDKAGLLDADALISTTLTIKTAASVSYLMDANGNTANAFEGVTVNTATATTADAPAGEGEGAIE